MVHNALGKRPPIWVFLLALVLVAIAYLTEREGVISTADGIVYTAVASNVADGRGLTVPFSGYTDQYAPAEAAAYGDAVPLRHWPPLYPSLLAAFDRLGFTPAAAASVLNPALFGLNGLLLAQYTRRLSSDAWAWAFLLVLALALLRDPEIATSSLVVLHASTLAEPLFLTSILVGLILLSRFGETGEGRDFWFASTVATLSTATKFNGLAFVLLVSVIGALCGTRRERLVRGLGSLSMGVLPSVFWMAAARREGPQPIPNGVAAALDSLVDGVSSMVAPASWPRVAAIVYASWLAWILTIALIRIIRARCDQRSLRQTAIPAALGALMVLQLVITRAFVDQNVRVAGRQMAVVHVLLLLAAVGVAGIAIRCWPRVVRGILALCLLVALIGGAHPLVRLIADPIQPPDNREVAGAIATIPEGHTIFTNIPDVVYQATGRTAHLVPCQTDYFTGLVRARYREEVEELRALIRSEAASVVLVSGLMGRPAECGSTLPFEGESEIVARRNSSNTFIASPVSKGLR